MKHTTSNDKKDLGNFLDKMIKDKASVRSKSSLTEQLISSKKMEQKPAEPIKGATNLMDYINKMMTAKKLEKTIDVAMPKRKLKDTSRNNRLPYEKRLTRAAKDVADTLGGDKAKTTSDLLQKVLVSRIEVLQEQEQMAKTSKSQSQKQPEQSKSPESKEQKNFETNSYSAQKSVINDLLNEYKKQSAKQLAKQSAQPAVENSISKQLLQSAEASGQQSNNVKQFSFRKNIDLWNGKPSGIFDNMGTASPDVPEMKTWTALQERELKMLTLHPPANIFQEMILWTDQGKLWKFPIDNEQGMDEEHNVHFSEHVFLERHLKDWCPKLGPIRHFMELVCIGLSKNPYMTVQEKVNHIMWYKEYFAEKEDLLQQLGAIQEPFPDKVKQIQE